MYATSRQRWGWVLMVVLGLVMSAGCRSRKRSEKVGSESLKVVIALKNIEDVAKDKIASLSFRMQCNNENWSEGTLTDKDKLEAEFFVRNLKVGDFCSVQVYDSNPPSEYQFKEESGVLYSSGRNIEISTRVGGQLWAEALLTRQYSLKSANEAGDLRIPVVFKEEIGSDGKDLTADIKCSPEFESLATGVQNYNKSSKSGEFVFIGALKPGVTYACSQMQIARDKALAFAGAFNETVTRAADGPLTADTVELSKVEVISVEGSIIRTTSGGECKSNEYFDLDSRTCKPRP